MTVPSEPNSLPTPPLPPEQQKPSRRPFWLGVGAGVTATVVVAGIAVGAVAGVGAMRTPATFDITGTFTVKGKATTSGLPADFACAGTGGYSDLSPTAAVKVSDESGTLLAKGHMTGSYGTSGYCVFDFTVADVPRGSKFYEVEIARRGGLTYTEAEAEEGLSLSIGD
ncbi:hypothetical protein GS488_18675 [Rhodococcus hoagii]|uniref:hypothetical protein n=1 Tax=Rhodococcus hoagii TaxID=43767 RepID=UPI0011A66E23|nr:hypothetical protein [Prescottella equi]NKS37676.1 hypothetical protein [Prescottella equi]